ncbi:class I lanthipeptide [Flavobacterium chungangense]|uniref:class I lanthipeptide n=1 Tax=Flavobacterium chungangense TaxID=554283 RepID=UPI0004DF7F3F|nr:class I lanthipeptide [Flavobacterium chungangense]
MKKLNLKKKVISELTDEQKLSIKGGGTTSYSECTGFLCCNYHGCAIASEGPQRSCNTDPDKESCEPFMGYTQ